MKPTSYLLACAIVAALAWPFRQPALAQAGTSEQDAVGFGDPPPPSAAPPAASAPPPATVSEPSAWTWAVSLRVRSAARLETSQPSRLANLKPWIEPRVEYRQRFGAIEVRGQAAVRAEMDFAYLADPALYDAATREQYAWQLQLGETYLQLNAGHFELSAGEQIVNWGQGEVLSVLDVISPRDLREPLLADARELRLPLLMTRAKFELDSISAELAVVHEAYFGILPPPLGEFSPFRALLTATPAFDQALADRTFRNRAIPARDLSDLGVTQGIGRLAWAGPNLDLAVLGGTVLDGPGVPSLPGAEAFATRAIDLTTLHPRYTLLGHAGSWTFGAFLLRWEAAAELGRALALRENDNALQFTARRRHQLRGLLGLTYAPSATTGVGLELSQTYVLDNPARDAQARVTPLFPVEATQLALRAQQRFLRERASVSLLLVCIGTNAWAGRIDLGYQLLDGLEVSTGVVTYQPTREFGWFYGFNRHDRIFVNLRYDVSG